MSEHRHPDHSTHHDLDWGSPTTGARTELEGEVLAGLVERALAVLGDLCAAGSLKVSRILDLGCGPGVFTCLLAQRFGSATILAVDGSAEMLDRAAARARRLALEQRVQTRLVELPAGLDSLGQADVVWASMVLHHVGDEVAAPLWRPDALAAPAPSPNRKALERSVQLVRRVRVSAPMSRTRWAPLAMKPAAVTNP